MIRQPNLSPNLRGSQKLPGIAVNFIMGREFRLEEELFNEYSPAFLPSGVTKEMDSRSELIYRDLLLELGADRSAGDILFASAGSGSRMTAVDESVPLYRHLASSIEIAFANKGEVRVATTEEVFRLTPGKLLVIERGVYHAQLPDASRPTHQVFWLHLNGTTAGLVDSVYSSPAASGFSYRLIELPGRTNVENIGALIISELANKGWGHPRAIAGLLRYLSCVLIRRLPRAQVSEPSLKEAPIIGGEKRVWEVLEVALEFCDANYRSPIKRSDIAKAVGYSPRHLSQLMSTHLGHSLFDHLRNLRVVEARRLLEKSDLSIKDIAKAVGYSDPAHFTRAFKRATGLSPRTYRRRVGAV